MKPNVRNGVLTAVVAAFVSLSTMIALFPFSGIASQGSNFLDTSGIYNGLSAANRINGALDALLTCNKGSSAPTNALGGVAEAGQCWLDSTSATLLIKKRYSGSAWVVEGVIDVTNGVWSPPVGGGSGSIAAAATTDLCTAPQAVQNVTTGSGTISSFGSTCPAGVEKTVIFGVALTLTYNATSLIVPSAANVSISAGDVIKAIALGSGNWRVTVISPISGIPVVTGAFIPGELRHGSFATAPAKTVFAFGQAISRASFPQFLAAVTRAQTGTLTSGNATITGVADTSSMGAGMPIEGTGIPAATTISSVTGSTILMSANATANGSQTNTVFFTGYGAGGSSSTVGVADCRGRVLAGRDDLGGTAASRLTSSANGFGAVASALNASGNSNESQTLIANQLPSSIPFTDPGHTHGFSINTGASANVSPSIITSGTNPNGTLSFTTASAGTGITINPSGSNPHRTVQPTLTVQCVQVLTQ